MVAQGALAASFPALELARQGRRRDSSLGLLQPGRSRTAGERQESWPPEGPAPWTRGMEGEVRAGRD